MIRKLPIIFKLKFHIRSSKKKNFGVKILNMFVNLYTEPFCRKETNII